MFWAGLVVVIFGLVFACLIPWIGSTTQNMNLILYTIVTVSLIAAVICLTLIALLATKKYRGRLQFVIPEIIALLIFVVLTFPIVRSSGDLFLLPPHNVADASKQIKSCLIANMGTQQGDSKIYLTYKSGRTATTNSKLWPQLRDAALSDPGHCGYKPVNNTGGPIQIVTLYEILP